MTVEEETANSSTAIASAEEEAALVTPLSNDLNSSSSTVPSSKSVDAEVAMVGANAARTKSEPSAKMAVNFNTGPPSTEREKAGNSSTGEEVGASKAHDSETEPQAQSNDDEAYAASLALEYGGMSLTAAEKVRLRRIARKGRPAACAGNCSSGSSTVSSGSAKAESDGGRRSGASSGGSGANGGAVGGSTKRKKFSAKKRKRKPAAATAAATPGYTGPHPAAAAGVLGVSVTTTTTNPSAAAAVVVGGAMLVTPTFAGEDGNLFYCQICKDVGNIVCCDGCPLSYHPQCLQSRDRARLDEDPWYCPDCIVGGGGKRRNDANKAVSGAAGAVSKDSDDALAADLVKAKISSGDTAAATTTTTIPSAAAAVVVEGATLVTPTFAGEDGNLCYCQICKDVGNIVCCDGCPLSYHPQCLPSRDRARLDEDPWYCPDCIVGGGGKRRNDASKAVVGAAAAGAGSKDSDDALAADLVKAKISSGDTAAATLSSAASGGSGLPSSFLTEGLSAEAARAVNEAVAAVTVPSSSGGRGRKKVGRPPKKKKSAAAAKRKKGVVKGVGSSPKNGSGALELSFPAVLSSGDAHVMTSAAAMEPLSAGGILAPGTHRLNAPYGQDCAAVEPQRACEIGDGAVLMDAAAVDEGDDDPEADANAAAADAAFAAFGPAPPAAAVTVLPPPPAPSFASSSVTARIVSAGSQARGVGTEAETAKQAEGDPPKKKKKRGRKKRPDASPSSWAAATGAATGLAGGNIISSGGHAFATPVAVAAGANAQLAPSSDAATSASAAAEADRAFGDFFLTAAEKAKLRRAKQAALKAPPPDPPSQPAAVGDGNGNGSGNSAADLNLAALSSFGDFALTAAEKAKLRRAQAAAHSPTPSSNAEEQEAKEERRRKRELKKKEKVEREEAAKVEFLRKVGLLPLEEEVDEEEEGEREESSHPTDDVRYDLTDRRGGSDLVGDTAVAADRHMSHDAASSRAAANHDYGERIKEEAGCIGRKCKRTGERGRPKKSLLHSFASAGGLGGGRGSRRGGQSGDRMDGHRRGSMDFAHLLSPRGSGAGRDVAATNGSVSVSLRPPVLELSDGELAQLSRSFFSVETLKVDSKKGESKTERMDRMLGTVTSSAGVGCLLTLDLPVTARTPPLAYGGTPGVDTDAREANAAAPGCSAALLSSTASSVRDAKRLLGRPDGAAFLAHHLSLALGLLPQQHHEGAQCSPVKKKRKRGRPPKKKKKDAPVGHNGNKRRAAELSEALLRLVCETDDTADVALETRERLASLAKYCGSGSGSGDGGSSPPSLISLARAVAREELALWSASSSRSIGSSSSPSVSRLRCPGSGGSGLALLRRLALPLCCRVVEALPLVAVKPEGGAAGAAAAASTPSLAACESSEGGETTTSVDDSLPKTEPVGGGIHGEPSQTQTAVVMARYSLLDVLLRVEPLRQTTIDAVLRRFVELSAPDGGDGDEKTTDIGAQAEASASGLTAGGDGENGAPRGIGADVVGKEWERESLPSSTFVPRRARHMRTWLLRSLAGSVRGAASASSPPKVEGAPPPPDDNAAATETGEPPNGPPAPADSSDRSEEGVLRSVRCALALAELMYGSLRADRLNREVLRSFASEGKMMPSAVTLEGVSEGEALRWGTSVRLSAGEMDGECAGAARGLAHPTTSAAMERFSCPTPEMRTERLAVRRERERLVREHAIKEARERATKDNADRRSGRKIRPMGRSYDGSLIITAEDMPIDAFLRRAQLMSKVNETLPRESIPGHSKPTLQSLGHKISPETVVELRSLFFDEDGSLRNDIRGDIDTSVKNDPRYINFRNRTCPDARNDRRWQVPLRHHGAGAAVPSRARFEELLSRDGVLHVGCEAIDDIGLLFGGNEDQSLHHDTARQMTSWMTERPLTEDHVPSAANKKVGKGEVADSGLLEPVAGWEIDRIEYNVAMASPYAPGSLLIGLGQEDWVLLGVQKDRTEKVGDGTRCKVHGGRPEETFRIVRENEHLVVLEIPTGCMFTGDFPHAGVRNFPADSPDDDLLVELNMRITAINARFPAHERVLRNKAMVEMMCNFKGLSRLCRLHCSTEMLKGHICVPPNTIGFTECLPNPPDRRCFEGDMVPECDGTANRAEGDGGRTDSDTYGTSSSSGGAASSSANEGTEGKEGAEEPRCSNNGGGCCSDGWGGESRSGAGGESEVGSDKDGIAGRSPYVDAMSSYASRDSSRESPGDGALLDESKGVNGESENNEGGTRILNSSGGSCTGIGTKNEALQEGVVVAR